MTFFASSRNTIRCTSISLEYTRGTHYIIELKGDTLSDHMLQRHSLTNYRTFSVKLLTSFKHGNQPRELFSLGFKRVICPAIICNHRCANIYFTINQLNFGTNYTLLLVSKPQLRRSKLVQCSHVYFPVTTECLMLYPCHSACC